MNIWTGFEIKYPIINLIFIMISTTNLFIGIKPYFLQLPSPVQ